MLTPQGGTRSSSSPSAGRGWLNPALSHPYSALAQPQPCPGTWAGLGRGEGTGQLWDRGNECVGLGGSKVAAGVAPSFLHADRRLGEEGGHIASQQSLLQPRAASPASPGIQPLHSHRVSNHPTDMGYPSPSSVQTPASNGIAPLQGEGVLVLRMDVGTMFVLRGFRGEQGHMGILSIISLTAQPKGG